MTLQDVLARPRWYCGRIWLGGGVVLLALAIAFSMRIALFLHRALRTQGIITQVMPGPQQDRNATYAASFSFTARNGKTYLVNAGVATNPPEFSVGDREPVLYDEVDPADAKIDSIVQLWFLPLLFAGLGVFFALAGGLLLLWEHRSNKKKALSSTAA